jgi:hypothetical protein
MAILAMFEHWQGARGPSESSIGDRRCNPKVDVTLSYKAQQFRKEFPMRRSAYVSLLTVALLTGAMGEASAATPEACGSLSKVALSQTKIELAQVVPAGAFVSPVPPGPGVPTGEYKDVPAFCRVTANIAPSADSDIEIEVWMPVTGWNGKFQGQGNGGFAGQISYGPMGAAVKRGYATASTDTGHTGDALHAQWAFGHPQKVIDFGYRGIHEMTLKAKAIIDAFYGRKPQHSYFASCSNGGRQALMEAQRFPADYNGIVAGAPANYWTHLFAGAAWGQKALIESPESFVPEKKLPAIEAAVLAACDAKDGVTDGILNDPRQCKFDPATLLCKSTESDACLTAPQVATLKKLYAGARDSQGHRIYGGLMPGFEEGWGPWVLGAAPGQALLNVFAVQYFSNVVYAKRDWAVKTFSLDRDLAQAEALTAHALNAIDPDLKPFVARGGKLILYQGWSDPATPPLNTINYYQSVTTTMGKSGAASFVRLFMVPGMEHCGGGPGPNYFGQDGDERGGPESRIYAAIEQWVEKNVAPTHIIATKYANSAKSQGDVKMTRPLCAFPQVAKYKGSGDINNAANFTCGLKSQ